MELGLIFALLSAVCFAVSNAFVRKGVFQAGESFTAIPISVFAGALLFSFLMLFTAEWGKLWSLSWQGFVLLGMGGIIHFVVGRFLFYSSVQLIGVNKGSAFLQTSSFYAVAFGIIFLNEPLTTYVILGALCIAGGATLVSGKKEGEISKMRGTGILSGLGGAFCYGISGVLIKPVIEEIGSPFAAVFISYIAAFFLIAGLLFCKGQREQLIQLRRASLIPLVISGVFVSTAQLFRYVALSYSPVSVVAPLINTNPCIILLLSFLLNRKIEVFSWKVITGVVMAVVGAFFLFY